MRKSYNFLLGVIAIGMYFLLSVDLAGAEEEKSPVYESKPKELVIYEGNMAFAKDDIQVYPADWIQVALPQTVIGRTLKIIDGEKRIGEFYFTQPAESTTRGTVIHNFQTVKWKSGLKKSREAILNYLLSGISWSPSYTMDILSDNKVRLCYIVAISNQTLSLSKANVKLVSGMVGKIPGGSGGVYREELRESQRALIDYNHSLAESHILSTIGPTRINAYYIYELAQMDTLEKGINYITVLDKELEAEKEFVWLTSAGEKVDVIYTIKNSAEQPFATGIVDTYQDGIYMGSDAIEWTPSGGKGHVTIGGAVDVQVRKTVNITEIPERNNNDEYHHEITLEIENFSKKDIKVKVIDNKYPDCVDIAFSLKPEEEKAQTYMWQIKLGAGKSKTIRYDFYSDNTYYEPYRSYR